MSDSPSPRPSEGPKTNRNLLSADRIMSYLADKGPIDNLIKLSMDGHDPKMPERDSKTVPETKS